MGNIDIEIPDLMTVTDAAKRIGVGASTIYGAIRRKWIKCTYKHTITGIGSRAYIKRDDLIVFRDTMLVDGKAKRGRPRKEGAK